MAKDFVYSQTDWGKEDPKEVIVPEITRGSSVLDVGCGVGGFGKWLKANRDAEVVGLDGHKDAVATAKTHLDAAYQVDLNDLSAVKKVVGSAHYDVITFIDVLEHCYHPQELLELFKSHLKPGGRIIVSLPNIAHYSGRWELLRGRFDDHDSGLFDRTHVKFYTRKSSQELLERAGLQITKTLNTSPSSGWRGMVAKVDPTLTAIQFVMIAIAS